MIRSFIITYKGDHTPSCSAEGVEESAQSRNEGGGRFSARQQHKRKIGYSRAHSKEYWLVYMGMVDDLSVRRKSIDILEKSS